jgi:preprotein translocase subunit SecD
MEPAGGEQVAMGASLRFRTFIVLAACAVAGYLLFPSYYYYTEYRPNASLEDRNNKDKFCAALPTWLPCKKFNLGLDLQGGMHLVMGVQADRAVEQRADRFADGLRDALKEASVAVDRLERPRGQATIEVTLAEGASVDTFKDLLRKDYSALEIRDANDRQFHLALVADEEGYVRDTAVEQTIKTIRNRADKLGVTEPTIARRGKENVLIQLPGVDDPQRAIDVIGRTAQLEFKIVDEVASQVLDGAEGLPEGVAKRESTVDGPTGESVREVYFETPAGKKDELRALLEPLLPGDREVAFGGVQNAAEGGIREGVLRTYVLEARAGITGDYLTEANVRQNPDLPSEYYVIMTFDTKGGKIFAELTEQNVKRRMAIVLDDSVNSAPIIEEKIGGGTARISLGGGDARKQFQNAKDLALVLKAGALPAPVEIREQRRVGATLGDASVARGETAIAVGAALVFLFMLLYYRVSGVIANLALVLNVVFVLSALAMFEATLTLPGIAGIVLTIGMAVDANVIIFERIREEMRIGKTPRAAVESGYARAFSAIFDSNVTTIIAGVVLMEYGSGPVRGFAVTLIIGILCSMFTAIVMTRVIFDYWTGRRRLTALSI